MKPIMVLLNKIQRDLKAPKAKYNKFGEYNYRNASDILTAAKPLLDEAVLTMSNTMIMVGDKRYVEATVTLSLEDETVSATAHAREDEARKKMNPEQLTGSASSYARKYALDGLFLTEDTPDPDTTNNGKGNDKPLSPVQAIKAVFKVFTDKHETSLPEGFKYDVGAFKKALKEKAAVLYEGETVKWTVDVITELATKLRPKDVWIEAKED